LSDRLLAGGIHFRKHHNCSVRQILLFPNFSMLGSHNDSRYLASSPIAFQLFQNLKSGQIRHHNVDKNCDQLLKKQPIAIFQLSWLSRSQYNEFVFTSFSANTEKLSSSSPIKTFAAESGADEGEFALASGISSPLAADISKEFSSSGAYKIGSLTKKSNPLRANW